jgi:hypothetical protein
LKNNCHFSSEIPASHDYHPAQLTQQHESAIETIHASIHPYLYRPATTSQVLFKRTAAPIERNLSIEKHSTLEKRAFQPITTHIVSKDIVRAHKNKHINANTPRQHSNIQ